METLARTGERLGRHAERAHGGQIPHAFAATIRHIGAAKVDDETRSRPPRTARTRNPRPPPPQSPTPRPKTPTCAVARRRQPQASAAPTRGQARSPAPAPSPLTAPTRPGAANSVRNESRGHSRAGRAPALARDPAADRAGAFGAAVLYSAAGGNMRPWALSHLHPLRRVPGHGAGDGARPARLFKLVRLSGLRRRFWCCWCWSS